MYTVHTHKRSQQNDRPSGEVKLNGVTLFAWGIGKEYQGEKIETLQEAYAWTLKKVAQNNNL